MSPRKTDTECLADAQEIIRQKNKLLASQAREIRRLKDGTARKPATEREILRRAAR